MPITRVASVIGLPAEHRAEYERHHAAVWPGVLDRLSRSHIHNYSIFRHGELLFAYFEYTGNDYDADMAAIAADPETQRWWAVQQPLQEPLEGQAAGQWLELPEIFHTE